MQTKHIRKLPSILLLPIMWTCYPRAVIIMLVWYSIVVSLIVSYFL